MTHMDNASSGHSSFALALLLLFFSGFAFEIAAVEYAGQFLNDLETIVPPYVDSYGAPSAEVVVVYKTNSSVGKVQLGRLYARNQTQARPHVTIRGDAIRNHEFYALVTVDPDSVSPANFIFRNILHWMVVNIPGDIDCHQDIAEVGDEIASYVGPAPSIGTHRYIFLLFNQGRRKIHPPAYPLPFFSVRNFTSTYDLGWPLGGTLFRVSFDDQYDFPATF